MISTYSKARIGNWYKIRDFTQKENYELYLLNILHVSDMFPDDLEIVESQNNGEYDYFSPSLNIYFEATLLGADLIGELNKKRNDGFNIWNTPEFQEILFEGVRVDFRKRLKAKSKKDSIVFFNIFPFRNSQPSARDFHLSVMLKFCSNAWNILMSEALNEEPELLNGKSIYIVSYNTDNTFYLERLLPINGDKEYLVRLSERDGFPFYSEEISRKDYQNLK